VNQQQEVLGFSEINAEWKLQDSIESFNWWMKTTRQRFFQLLRPCEHEPLRLNK